VVTARRLAAVLVSGLALSGCLSKAPAPVAVQTPVQPAGVAPSQVARPAVTLTPLATPQPKATAAVPSEVIGNDISWPQCPVGTPGALPKKQGKGAPLPGPSARFVVIGLTNGPGFYPNPCLAWEVRQARLRGLPMSAYAFTTMPNAAQVVRYGGKGPWSARTALGRMQNAAYAEAQINVASLRAVGLKPPLIWIDVEPQPYLSPWGSDVPTNQAVIRAVQRSYRDRGFQTGLYSSDNPWKAITGGMVDSGPTWVTVGPRGKAKAVLKCAGPSFSGGRALMAQWWDDEVVDKDLLCPGTKLEDLFVR
jgi:hypothetical protein